MGLHLPGVCEFQPNVDWRSVTQRNGGAAIVRALHGGRHVDRAWYGGARRFEAHKSGVRVLGICQYLTADEDAVDQADAFVRLVGRLAPGEFAVVDVEEGAGDQLGRAQAWLERVDAGLSYPGYCGAWLGSGATFCGDHGLMPIVASGRATWVASHGTSPPAFTHTLWRHTDRESWPGICACGCSIYDGDLDGLERTVHLAAG
jgi:hypothetical protein